ncbi:hypothetical protein C5167_014969 [Papaver somniferum]|uniref:Uncharacterized protein n=1 Tax=Papaver somniferum TaxID=3469 RepID=A0A4Y7J7T6_PAPSO|nr:hypothetical protein C5167_014969 [Papaver somniferum]
MGTHERDDLKEITTTTPEMSNPGGGEFRTPPTNGGDDHNHSSNKHTANKNPSLSVADTSSNKMKNFFSSDEHQKHREVGGRERVSVDLYNPKQHQDHMKIELAKTEPTTTNISSTGLVNTSGGMLIGSKFEEDKLVVQEEKPKIQINCDQRYNTTSNSASRKTLSVRQFMDPNPSKGAILNLDMNEPSHSEAAATDDDHEMTTQQPSTSVTNYIEAEESVSKEYHLFSEDVAANSRKRPTMKEETEDINDQVYRSNLKNQKSAQSKSSGSSVEEEVPPAAVAACRKARVSVRAQSEAPLSNHS